MRNLSVHPWLGLVVWIWLGMVVESSGAPFWRRNPPMRKAADLIRRQEPPVVYMAVEPMINPDNARIVVSLTMQRLWLMAGDRVYIDTPISSGKSVGMTPTGNFIITEKDPDHRSNIYGSFVDSMNRIVRDGVSVRVDSAPSGTHFVGAPMKWFMRLNQSSVGLHVGILPGYPASHGCVRLPPETAALIYRRVKHGTPVTIEP